MMNTTLYVDNLTLTTTESDLLDLFAQHGRVEAASVSTEASSGRSRGFGFVTMATPAEARSAMRALNGKAIGPCTLSVSEAWPHERCRQ